MSTRPVAGQGHVEDGGLKQLPLIARMASSVDLACRSCGTAMVMGEVWFPGMPILAEYRCGNCGAVFLVDWPAGHALLHPTMVRADTGEIYYDGSEWYPRALQRLLASRDAPAPAAIEVRRQAQQQRTALVVNCIDYVYGHWILKLLSGVRHLREPGADVVLIVPKKIAWLVPAGAHTVVEVDVSLRDGGRWLSGLDETIKQVLEPYEVVRIAPTPSQPSLTSADIAAIAGRPPFDLWKSPSADPQVTIVLREDRAWTSTPRWIEKLRLERMIPGAIHRRLAIARQNRRFATVVRQIHAVHPNTRVVVTGQGRTGRLRAAVTDLRREQLTLADELEWLGEYERTTVVIGMHGSHMLLPSALAGAVIDLTPPSKLPNVTQDLLIARDRDEDPKLLLFRQRIIPSRATPETVSEITASLIADRSFHHRNVIENQAADGSDWVRPIDWHRLRGASGG